jgi:hypothetical protein
MDPLWIESPFPWAALAPLMSGLRHGFAQGMGSALLLTLALGLWSRLGLAPGGAFPSVLSVGLLLTGMIAGEFCDAWGRRLHRLAARESYSRLRLEEFSRAYHLLRASHARLEQDLIGSVSLRTALERLRRLSALGARAQRVAQEALTLLAEFVPLDAAALYEVAPRRSLRELHHLGPLVEVAGDPLVEAALRSGQLHYADDDGAQGPLLAAVPLKDSGGTLRGLLTVHHGAPEAVSRERLELLALIGGHLGDLLVGQAEGGLEQPMRRCLEDARYGIPSVALGLVFAEGTPAGLADLLLSQRRTLDHAELGTGKKGSPVILMLMPLTDERGLEGFVARLERLVLSRYGADLKGLGLRLHRRVLARGQDPRRVLRGLYAECDVHVLNVHAA